MPEQVLLHDVAWFLSFVLRAVREMVFTDSNHMDGISSTQLKSALSMHFIYIVAAEALMMPFTDKLSLP